jgi:Ca-activated chloride channel family protein
MQRSLVLVGLSLTFFGSAACRARDTPVPASRPKAESAQDQTFAELRTIKGALTVRVKGEAARPPYRRERLVEGEVVELPAGALAWMRRDGGATWLVAGPASLTVHADDVELSAGRAFIDSELGAPVQVSTARGKIELSDARASLELQAGGVASVYVLRGSARAALGGRVGAGEIMTLRPDGSSTRAPVVSWDDWTGGLATADPVAEPAPFGIGTVGARKPSDQGKPRFSLVVQRLDVKVTVEQDFAITEVDETFVNPSSDTVEGIFSFRTPPGAVLSRFGVDRQGELTWGRVKELKSAVQQYESNVYEGSEEDPALLQWSGLGLYNARLYPIRAGTTRRVVTRYSEWLPREGPNGERRLYVYPMAAEGARASLPRIEELRFTLELGGARASRVRAGMAGKRDGNRIVVKAFDFVPRADLAVELFDAGQSVPVAYRAPHRLGPGDVPENAETNFARDVAREEADYIAVPLRVLGKSTEGPPGIDIGVVIDSSAATEPGALSIARSMTSALLAQLGPDDRAALWAGDASLHPVAEGSGTFVTLDASERRAWLAGLASVERGGATDLGALLSEAASQLDPKRRGAILYVGDGQPTVGELAPKSLRERLGRLPQTTRILAASVGSQPNVALLETLVRGAPVEQVQDAYGAARAALRLLEAAGRPLWLGAKVNLGAGVERVLPRDLPPISSDETTLVVGRITGKLPTEITLTGSGGSFTRRLTVTNLADSGDLRRRWGQARLSELIAEGSGRASLVELARRYALVSPFTALYVPTEREQQTETAVTDEEELPTSSAISRKKRWKPWWSEGKEEISKQAAPLSAMAAPSAAFASRAKGEEASRSIFSRGASKQHELAPMPEEKEGGAASKPAATIAPAPPQQLGMLDKDAAAATNDFGAAAAVAEPTPAAAPAAGARMAGASIRPGVVGGGLSGLSASGSGELPVKARRGLLPNRFDAHAAAQGAKPSMAPPPPAAPRAQRALRAVDSEPARPAPLPAASTPAASPVLPLGIIGHEPRPCGASADLPFTERKLLWKERLVPAGSVELALSIYRQALRDCEAVRWDERAALLVFIVDRLPLITDRVSLWRALLATSPAAADAVYRFLLLRVQTASDLKELHDALGLSRIDPSILTALLKKAASNSDRLSLLRGAAERFPDDTELALLVLDAYEDARDDAGGRAWARRLRRRVDASSHVRTNVGEYYLRLGARENAALAKRDAEEARRTFGELVEFAAEDPLARRRLGDLLRAHGWYEEAFRQYQTLAELTPDDPSVPLLLAAAANGVGRTEEAVRWAQKVADSGAPDGSTPVSLAARALASAFLAWARLDATRAGHNDEVERLRARAARLAASDSSGHSGVRFIVTWEHPELRPSLWTNALGSPMPAPDNLPLYGVAQAFVADAPPPLLELRLDEEDAERAARLGAKAVLTAIANEGTANERIARLELGFRDEQQKPQERVLVRFEQGELRIEKREAAAKEAP